MATVRLRHGTLDGYSNWKCRCDSCKAAKSAWCVANRHKTREWNAKRKVNGAWRDQRYGLAPGRFQQMRDVQGDCCAICHSPFGDAAPLVDHDHNCCPGANSCGTCVRGLLCRRCNTGIGQLGDDPERLRSALAYLTGGAH